MDMSLAKQYAENIISILHKGEAPPITALHAKRVCEYGLPPLMPASLKQQIKTFDPNAINKNMEGLFTQHPGAVRVERIATCMGCVMTTCVVEVEQLTRVTNGLISWAKPIIEAAQAKSAICMDWRKKLELGSQQDQAKVVMDPSTVRKMQVFVLFDMTVFSTSYLLFTFTLYSACTQVGAMYSEA
jgi:hypothetical protein